MVSSNATEETINFFLSSIQMQNPDVSPEYFMSDKDHAQMNAISRQYPKSAILLCWWHVLHAWHQHFNTTEFPELWNLLKDWIRITDQTEFWQKWANIKKAAPKSVIEYLETYWLPVDTLRHWSAVFRANRTIFQ